jgi:tetratricopeptide (TPR) repeat protein
MKRLSSITAILLLIFSEVFAQKKSTIDEYSRQVSIYTQALSLNDLTIARNAVYQILAIRPTADSWNDTLCMLYFSDGMYRQSILVGKKSFNNNPSNIVVGEIIAVSYERLGAFKEAIETYQELVKQKDEIRYLYSILTLEYKLKRFEECLATAEKIITRPDAMNNTIRINVSDQHYQDVPYAAAVYNILGMLFIELSLKEQAEKYFQKSLELAPDFILPKNNMSHFQFNTK